MLRYEDGLNLDDGAGKRRWRREAHRVSYLIALD